MKLTRDQVRARAEVAKRLLEDADVADLLNEIEMDAKAVLLASGGDPARLRDAWAIALIPQQVRARLQTRLANERDAAKREQRQ